MSLIGKVSGRSPFSLLVEHSKKVHECVKLMRPLMEACIKADHEEVHRLQDMLCKLEHEADQIKHEGREHLPRRYFLPAAREDLGRFLHCQDNIADSARDFAVVLLIRSTHIYPALADEFLAFVDQVVKVSETLVAATEQLDDLAETSFTGAEAELILKRISSLCEGEWAADRMQRKLSRHIYDMEKELDPVTVFFYERILHTLGATAGAAENTGDLLRSMIIRG